MVDKLTMALIVAGIATVAYSAYRLHRHARSRRKSRALVGWQPDTRSETERLESYRDQKLREMGLDVDTP